MSRATVSGAADYSVFAAWSRPSERLFSDILNVVVSVPLTAEHYRTCSWEQTVEDVALALDSLIYDGKDRKPERISFLLYLNGADSLIPTLADSCFPLAEHSHDHYIDVIIAEIVRLFRESNEYTPCGYVTIWNNEPLLERIMAPARDIARKGQVIFERGIYRAKLLPMTTSTFN
jgi:hypothetical protein